VPALAALVATHGDLQGGGPPSQRLVRQATDHGVAGKTLGTAPPTPPVGLYDPAGEDRPVGFESLSDDGEAEAIKPSEGGQVGPAEAGRRGSVGHVEVFQMVSMRTSIFGRPRLLPRDRRASRTIA
jgi:hypothetical protein